MLVWASDGGEDAAAWPHAACGARRPMPTIVTRAAHVEEGSPMLLRMVYDDRLAQAAWLIGCQKTGEAIVIDPERDVDRYIALARAEGLRLTAVAETHIHADFLSGARELAERVGARVYVSGMGGSEWSSRWLESKRGGGAYDHRVLRDGDTFQIGNIELHALHTPGHTPEHLSYMVTDRGSGATEPMGVVTGDFLFVGDLGRPDLLETAAKMRGTTEPAARELYRSATRLLDLPDYLQVWPAHGSGSACGKALGAVPQSTIGYERRFNPMLGVVSSRDEDAFVREILDGQPEPPMYFARMKRDNRDGPRILGELSSPRRLPASDLARHRGEDGDGPGIVLDARPWDAFRAGHVPGAIYCPLDKLFFHVAGSYIAEDDPITLVCAPGAVEELVRSLVRIGLDEVRGWVDASELESIEAAGGGLASVPEYSARDAGEAIDSEHPFVLDVRSLLEFDAGHLPGAVNVAYTRLAEHTDRIPRGRRVLVNCRSGRRSGSACSYLRRLGYDAANLAGGYLAWQQASGETVA